METIERDYAPQGVQFYYLYKQLAHPELDHYVDPYTLEERLMHVAQAERQLGSRIPWIADAMTNELKHALGDMPNSEFIIDPEGRILARRAWSDPTALRDDLERLIGPVENPTQLSDLDMPSQPPVATVAKGIVPRVTPPGRMMTLKVALTENSSEHLSKILSGEKSLWTNWGSNGMTIITQSVTTENCRKECRLRDVISLGS